MKIKQNFRESKVIRVLIKVGVLWERVGKVWSLRMPEPEKLAGCSAAD